MNKTAIKNFAIWARVQLIEAAKQRAYEYEITENGENKSDVESIGGRVLSNTERNQRRQLIAQIQQKGYAQVMEEAAYTWFNRFIALRFMEVNGYLPAKIRIFTDDTGAFKPEILKQAMAVELDGLDRNTVLALLDAQANETLYKYLLITQCNALNASLPYMFEKIANWTELLFPANLLRNDSVLGHMVSDIPEEDWQDAVQIIGWLYQYYNTELKDDTFAQLKKNVKITKERIPAATQLFTPDWIVRYMVENSLGRLWLEGHPNAELRGGWNYYLDEAEQEPEVEAQLAKLREEYKTIKPEEIKVIDPCMGSGHILVYAFDVLMQIYTSAGWDQREAAQSILKNNLFGLDIDDRAAQLAYFAVMMKARQYDRRLLTRGIQPNIYSIRESNGIQAMTIEYFHKNDPKLKADIERIVTEMRDAKEYGSILNITPVDFAGLCARFDEIREDINMMQKPALEELLPLVKCDELLAQKYDVVVTNPPYMGSSGMCVKLSDFLKKHYPNSKSDLCATFIERGSTMAKQNRFTCMVTMQSWMFLSAFEKLRINILEHKNITNLMHMDNMVLGIAFGTAVSCIRNVQIEKYKGIYNHIKSSDIIQDAPFEFPVKKNRFAYISSAEFMNIPGSPMAYWESTNTFDAFKNYPALKEKGKTTKGIITGNNDKYLRSWWEISFKRIGLDALCLDDAISSKKKWFPVCKGGAFRKWYGNREVVINWENNGYEIRELTTIEKRHSQDYYPELKFQKAISWSSITNGVTSFRYEEHNLVEHIGLSIFLYDNAIYEYILGFLNSVVTEKWLQFLSPTITKNAGEIERLPIKMPKNSEISCVIRHLVETSIDMSSVDWDSYETSWDFKRNPLV